MTALWNDLVRVLCNDTGFLQVDGPMLTMWALSGVLFYLAVAKKREPLLLLALAFGMLLANLPSGLLPPGGWAVDGAFRPASGLYGYLEKGMHPELFAPLVFLGIGALTDFAPLIASPRALILGGVAQLGVFVAMFLCVASGTFTVGEAGSIGIAAAASWPVSIFAANKLALQLIGPIAVASYACLSLAPLIQPPIMKVLTSAAERTIRMKSPREVGKPERIAFSLAALVLLVLVAPEASPLFAMLMLGNLLRESGVAERLATSCRNEILQVATLLIGTTVGMTMRAETFLRPGTLAIILLGIAGLVVSTVFGVLMAKVLNAISPQSPLNPLIGSAGVAALPGAARISEEVGVQYDPHNSLLPHAMGANVAGVIGTALTAGYLLSRLP